MAEENEYASYDGRAYGDPHGELISHEKVGQEGSKGLNALIRLRIRKIAHGTKADYDPHTRFSRGIHRSPIA